MGFKSLVLTSLVCMMSWSAPVFGGSLSETTSSEQGGALAGGSMSDKSNCSTEKAPPIFFEPKPNRESFDYNEKITERKKDIKICRLFKKKSGVCPEKSKLNSKFFSGEKGIASWYGENFHGLETASGEFYDMNKMTAAHKNLPFGTEVEVYNKTNGLSVKVKINDRGPSVPGRIINLSRLAAEKLDMIEKGICEVQISVTN